MHLCLHGNLEIINVKPSAENGNKHRKDLHLVPVGKTIGL
jgi:hypothetical protein